MKLSKLLILPFALRCGYNQIINPVKAFAQEKEPIIFLQENIDFDISKSVKGSLYLREFDKSSYFNKVTFKTDEKILLKNEYYPDNPNSFIDFGAEIYRDIGSFLAGIRYSLEERGFVISSKNLDKKLFIGSSKAELTLVPKNNSIRKYLDEAGIYYKREDDKSSAYAITLKKRW
jgi:hypothetical protein